MLKNRVLVFEYPYHNRKIFLAESDDVVLPELVTSDYRNRILNCRLYLLDKYSEDAEGKVTNFVLNTPSVKYLILDNSIYGNNI